VQAPGLVELKNALLPLGDVYCIAPERPRSATGHAITLHKPLRLNKSRMDDGSIAWMANGSPADCVTLGVHELMQNEVDLVVSGINHGPNLGWDVHYSGTVAAAMEAVMTGYPGIAASVASWDERIHWNTAARFVARLAKWLLENPLPPHTVLNVNAPNLPEEELNGVEITSLGARQYFDRTIKCTDPAGRDYYWLGGSVIQRELMRGEDAHAVAHGKISVTPLQLDLTAHKLFGAVSAIEKLG
jgi:5'-nucleotidase